ncbi:unnamed protein product [Heligmosomoides polygyrus]|uniref:Endo/exonuclease/phosphatase domain-containing protein n=1 Tax=Heligmosomoides polygyrus TaxID=6339 RepID=A0A183GQS4_HELPZ|nr:unnamed protein product [Heligmosomoides polygyrus]
MERLLKSQGLTKLRKLRMTRMTICTYNARTLASEAYVEDLMMQAKKIKYDVIGLTEKRRHHPLHAPCDSGEELFLGTCDSRGVGGVGILINTHLAMNIDSFDCVHRVCPTSDCDDEEIEAFYVELEKEDHTFCKVIVGDFKSKIGPRMSPEEIHIGAHNTSWTKNTTASSIISKIVLKVAESLKTTNVRLSPETLELKRQRGAARASGNYQLTSELAKLCREAIKEDLNERRGKCWL